MTFVNVGVIGTGSIASAHLTAYRNHPGVKLLAVCDVNERRAREQAELYGAAKAYTNYREMLADPDIDAISICTWNNSHAEISIAALDAGKHVLCEKPLSRTVEEALRVEEAVRRSGNIFQVGFVRRYGMNAQVLKQFIDAGELGDIYYAKASCLRRIGNPGGWFADKERSGGGPLIDLGVHMIDLCWYMMGKPKVTAVFGNTYDALGNRSNIENLSYYKASDYDADKNTVEDCANAILRFENGASLMVDVSFSLHAKEDEFYVKLYGTKGGAELEPALTLTLEKHNTILNVDPQIDRRSFTGEDFANQIDHFIGCCRDGRTPNSSVEDGLELMKMLCAIYEAAESKKEVVFI